MGKYRRGRVPTEIECGKQIARRAELEKMAARAVIAGVGSIKNRPIRSHYRRCGGEVIHVSGWFHVGCRIDSRSGAFAASALRAIVRQRHSAAIIQTIP